MKRTKGTKLTDKNGLVYTQTKQGKIYDTIPEDRIDDWHYERRAGQDLLRYWRQSFHYQ